MFIKSHFDRFEATALKFGIRELLRKFENDECSGGLVPGQKKVVCNSQKTQREKSFAAGMTALTVLQ